MKRLPRGMFELGSPVIADPKEAGRFLVQTGYSVMVDIDKIVRSRLLVNANSGAGKSWAVRRIVEQTFGGVPTLLLDPEGEFHTLRERFDFVLAGRPGGQKGDCPAEPKSAALLARRLLELGVSAVIDLFELDPADRILFAKRFVEALLDAPRQLWRPTLVVIDEAHVFCPEKGEGEAASRDAVIGLMSKGRKRGFGGVLATQRLSKLHKSAAAEANNVLIGRTALDVDLDRAGRALGYDRARRDVLKKLPPGRFHAFGPAISDEVIVVHVGPVHTHHPEAGDHAAPPAPPRDQVKKILGQLAALPEEAAAEARTVDELRTHVKALERELRTATTALKGTAAGKPDPAVIDAAVAKAVKEHGLTAKKHFERQMRECFGALETATLQAMRQVMNLTLGAARETPAPTNGHRATSTTPADRPVSTSNGASSGGTSHVQRRVRQPDVTMTVTGGAIAGAIPGITGPMRKLVDALAWFEGIGVPNPTLPALAFMAGYSPKSSTFENVRGACRTAELVTYAGGGLTALTPKGRSIATAPDVPQTNEGLQQAILDKLDGPAAKLLRALLPHGSEGLTHDQLADATGYSGRSSTFENVRGKLRTLGLAVYPSSGRTAAAAILYPED